MPDAGLGAVDRKLMGLLQRNFPLVREPFRELAGKLGMDESELIERIDNLKYEGVVRQISPVMDARRLGYQSTLVAMKVNEPRLSRARYVIEQHPGVSHGYEREHELNVWFTLSVPPEGHLDDEVRKIAERIGTGTLFSLPALKLFKIGAYFNTGEHETGVSQTSAELPRAVDLSAPDRSVINVLQRDLPLTPSPFESIAGEAQMAPEDFLAQCRSLVERGAIRRYGAAINHRRAGFHANAMTCWLTPAETVEAAGRELAALREVSHCYERLTNPDWPYNLFAMLHGETRGACETIVREVSNRLGLKEYIMLYSTREFKKTRIRYAV